MWGDWSNNLSSDQVLGVIKALQISLENEDDYKKLCSIYTDIQINPYMSLMLKNFFCSYKRGDINLALTNRIHFKELFELQEKNVMKKEKNKKISFNPKLSLCLMETNETENYKQMPANLLNKEQVIFMTCISQTEAQLYKNTDMLLDN